MTSPRSTRGGEFPLLPAGFQFGTGLSAYQSEGAVDVEGRGPSIWDSFVRTSGRVRDGSTAEVAADAYRRVDEDVQLLAGLGLRHHKFSVSWSRVLPAGCGEVNEVGLDHYDRLVDRLLEVGVAPMVTLHHWDLPQALEDDGGWLNRHTADAFAEYAEVVGGRLADRVEQWVPLHDPNVASIVGYGVGGHAPGKALVFDCLPAAHHMLVAHGLGAQALRAAGARSVGCSTHHVPVWPTSDEPEDTGASKLFDMLWNGCFSEPMLLGRYPADIAPIFDEVARPGDLSTIRQPLDFYGISWSNPLRVGAAPEDADVPFVRRDVMGYPRTDAGAPIVPDALREFLIMFRARYRAALPPLVLTEVGAAFRDTVDAEGRVDDQQRIDYLDAHLRAVSEAVNRGVDVQGFYAWSLLDQFDWVDGYASPTGLVRVDPKTQERTPKGSYDWYAALIASQPVAN